MCKQPNIINEESLLTFLSQSVLLCVSNSNKPVGSYVVYLYDAWRHISFALSDVDVSVSFILRLSREKVVISVHPAPLLMKTSLSLISYIFSVLARAKSSTAFYLQWWMRLLVYKYIIYCADSYQMMHIREDNSSF